MKKNVKVAIVDDSKIAANALRRIIEKDEQIEVIAVYHSGEELLEKLDTIKPDLITMDLNMPGIGGLKTIKKIINREPLPILVITDEATKKNTAEIAFESMQAGALDLIPKPIITDEETIEQLVLREKIKILAKVKLTEKQTKIRAKKLADTRNFQICKSKDFRIIGIVCSTGGPKALISILRELPSHFPAPILIVQHLSKGFTEQLVYWLGNECSLDVNLAEDGDLILPGVVYLAPDNYHLKVSTKLKIMLEKGDPVDGHLPSGNILLSSLAASFGNQAVGVILSGMGSDGSNGVMDIKNIGGETVAQDEESSVVYGMPRAAIENEAIKHIMNLDDIPYKLMSMVGMQTPSGRSPDVFRGSKDKI